MTKHRTIGTLAGVLTLTLLSACGNKADTSATSPPANPGASTTGGSGASSAAPTKSYADLPAVNKMIADQFPSEPTTLNVATDPIVPPATFAAPDGTVVGFEADLLRAVGAISGRKVNVTKATFSGIIAALQAKRYDMAFGTIGIKPARLKVVDMVSISQSGDALVTKSNSGLKVNGLKELCGLKVALVTGSTYKDKVDTASQQCVADGKKPAEIQEYPQGAAVDLAVNNGRAQIEVTDQLSAIYQSQQHPGTLTIQSSFDVNPNGIALPKGSPLTQPVHAALQQLITDGTYGKIMNYWQSGGASVTTSTVNGPVSQ